MSHCFDDAVDKRAVGFPPNSSLRPAQMQVCVVDKCIPTTGASWFG